MSQTSHLRNNLPIYANNPLQVSLDAPVGTPSQIGGTLVIGAETLIVIAGAGTADLLCNRGATPAAHTVGDLATYTAPASGGAQTPWASDIDAAGFPLHDVGGITTTKSGSDPAAVDSSATSLDGDASVQSTALANGDGAASTNRSATAWGVGAASSDANAISNGTADASAQTNATTAFGGGVATAGATAQRVGSGTASITAIADVNSARIVVSSDAGTIPDLVAALAALPQLTVLRVLQTQFVDDGGNGVVDPMYTIPAGKVLLRAGVYVPTAFPGEGGNVDLNEKSSGKTLADGFANAFYSGIGPLTQMTQDDTDMSTWPYYATTDTDLIAVIPSWNNSGGTTGVVDFYLWLITPPAAVPAP